MDDSASLTLGPASGIAPSTAEGEALIITGTVLDESCTPLADAVLHVWQTDAEGRYGPGHDSGDLQCCYLQGTVRTDSAGRYQLETVMPGHYQGEQPPPPAHIHVEASHAEAGGLTTEIVFADDPYLGDPDAGGRVVATLTPEPEAEATLHGVADLVLSAPS